MEYTELTKHKIQLYYAALYLFDHGYSHPQVVKALSEFYEQDIVLPVTDQAMVDLWRTIFNRVQELTALGYNVELIRQDVSGLLDDPEILHYIINRWYSVQTFYIDQELESQTNLTEGSKYFILSLIGTVAVFYFKASIYHRVIWTFVTVASLGMYLFGLYQKRLAKKVRRILDTDYTAIKGPF